MKGQVSLIDGYEYEPPSESEIRSMSHSYCKPQSQYGLANNGKHCKDCKFVKHRDFKYKKCAKWLDTSSSATDIRLKWDACALFKPEDDDGTEA